MATKELAKPRKASSGCPVIDDMRFHRVASVREQQGLSLRSAARQMGVEIQEVRRQEQETTDLNLSELYRWQQILGVPIGELLDDNGSPLSRPVMERAHLVRIMKTVKTLKERAETDDEVVRCPLRSRGWRKHSSINWSRSCQNWPRSRRGTRSVSGAACSNMAKRPNG